MLRQPGNILLAVVLFGLVAVAGYVITSGVLSSDENGTAGSTAQEELQPEQWVLFSDLGMT